MGKNSVRAGYDMGGPKLERRERMFPEVSIIMSVHAKTGQDIEYLQKAIESILNQKGCYNIEFIIFDDGSQIKGEDCCVPDVLNSYHRLDKRIKHFYSRKCLGLTRRLNQCIKLSRGKYIARQDADDISEDYRLKKQLDMFKENEGKNLGMVTCWGRAINPDDKFIQDYYIDVVMKSTDEINYENLSRENLILGPAVMYSAEVVKKIGGYDESLYLAQDYNYYLRIAKYFKIKPVCENLYRYRRNTRSVRKRYAKFKKVDWAARCRERAEKCPVVSL